MQLRHDSRTLTIGARLVWMLALLLVGCSAPPQRVGPAETLTFYSWAEYMPQAVLDEFEAETGIHVDYIIYESQEEAAAAIRSHGIDYDVAVVAYDWVPGLREAGLLAKLDQGNIPNFKNISPQFRNLFYDPDNGYTVPYLWGTTGLLVRNDLLATPIVRWADLWTLPPDSPILARPVPAELFGVALLAQGDDLNSEAPAELAAALARLQMLKPRLRFVPVETEDALSLLVAGEAVIMIGWNGDALAARAENPDIAYVLPQEGAIAWVDNLVVSADSRSTENAEAFINFVLRPEISARISEAYYYPSANEAANLYVGESLRTDPMVFPRPEDIANLVFYMPHAPEAQQLYEMLWQEFETND